MGQRLPSFSGNWVDQVIQGNAKRTSGAARVAAEGTDALAAGVARGFAGITAGLLRKRAEGREDARNAKMDARWEAEFGMRKDEAQERRDEFHLRYLQADSAQIQERLLQEQQGADILAATTGAPDPAAMQRAAELAQRLQQNQQIAQTLLQRRATSRVPSTGAT